jgi:hypothetical protein
MKPNPQSSGYVLKYFYSNFKNIMFVNFFSPLFFEIRTDYVRNIDGVKNLKIC